MKAFFKNLLVGGLFIFAFASPVMTVVTPQTALAASACENSFLGIPPWYRGLTNDNPPDCTMKSPDEVGGIGNYVWMIVLNVIQMAVSALAIVTVFFIIYGGFLYLTGGALPAQLEKARKTIFNAVIGLVICLAAVALTNLVFAVIS